MGIFQLLKRRTRFKVVFCGLDNSGKTTIISFLKEGKFIQHHPTMGKQKREVIVEGTRITIFDMGGQSQFRKMWLGELNDSKMVVYVIDKFDKNRYQESKFEFKKLVPIIKNRRLDLLVILNKYDLDPVSNIEEIIEIFELNKLDKFEIVETSAKTGYKMVDAFIKFYSLLTGEYIEKNKVAKSIGIYSISGKPLMIETKDELHELFTQEEEAIMNEIKKFKRTPSERIKIKLKENPDIYLLLRKNSDYIGSLIWTNDLGISLENSDETLRDLLEHLSMSRSIVSKQDLAFNIAHYCTNLL